LNLSAQRAFHRYPARLPFAGASASQTNSGGDYLQRRRSGGSDGEEVVAMSFISDNIGYFVVGLFLVLAALDGYSLCRPPSTAESVLFERKVAAAAAAAVPILVLFLLRGWRVAAAGAVLFVLLRAGYYFLYCRSIPHVRPFCGPNNRRPTGDKIMSWFKPPATLDEFIEHHGFDDVGPALAAAGKSLESLASITAGDLVDAGVDTSTVRPSVKATQWRKAYQELSLGHTYFRDLLEVFHETAVLPNNLKGCHKVINVPPTLIGEARTKAEMERYRELMRGRLRNRKSYLVPRWNSHPWRHRLHTTLEKRIERYQTEFAAENDAWERLNLLVKERDAAGRPPSRELKQLRQEALEKDLARRGMVVRVLTCVEINQ